MLFANVTLWIGSRGVEIAKDHPTQAVGLCVPVQHALDEQLGFAIRVYRSLRMFFADRQTFWYAVGGARGGKNDLIYARICNSFQKVQRVSYIIQEVCPRDRHRFA